jgi:hypothetical protein
MISRYSDRFAINAENYLHFGTGQMKIDRGIGGEHVIE